MEEYEKRCRETLALRLLTSLHDNGHISEREFNDLMYPSIEALDEAEGLNDG